MCFGSHFVICVLCTVVSSDWGGYAPGALSYAISLLDGWLGPGFFGVGVWCMIFFFLFFFLFLFFVCNGKLIWIR